MFLEDLVNFFLAQEREYLDPFLCIYITGIYPKLVKLERRGSRRIKPNIPLFGFSKLGPICFCDQGTGKCECLTPQFFPDQFGAGNNISPLITSTHLEFAVLIFILPVKIITLHHLVGKLSITKPFISFNSSLYAILSHHIIHRDVLARIT